LRVKYSDFKLNLEVYNFKNLEHLLLNSLCNQIFKLNHRSLCSQVGGAPWSAEVPMKGTLFVGFDVSHDTTSKSLSYGCLQVASLNDSVSRFFSIMARQKTNGEELSNEIGLNVVKAMRKNQNADNQILPTRMFIHCDGVRQCADHQPPPAASGAGPQAPVDGAGQQGRQIQQGARGAAGGPPPPYDEWNLAPAGGRPDGQLRLDGPGNNNLLVRVYFIISHLIMPITAAVYRL
jgi:Piwi domain